MGSVRTGQGSLRTAAMDSAGGGGSGAVNKIIAGPGISVSPGSGVGNVTVSADVRKIIAGDGLTVTPGSGIGNVLVDAIDALRPGADLPNADITWNPGSDQTSLRTLQAATLTGDHTCTLGVANSPPIGTKVKLIVKDLGAHTYTWRNGGPSGAVVATFGPSMLTPRAAVAAFDGTNWNNVDPTYQAGGTYAAPTDPLFLSPLVWLRADLGVTLVAGKCSAWADQSGNGNNAAQTTAGNRPTFNASSIGGKPAMTGTTGTGMNLATGVFTAGQQRWLVAVVKAAVGTGGVVFETRTTAITWTAAAGNLGSGDFDVYSDLSSRTMATAPAYAYDGAGHVLQYASAVGAPIGFAIDGAAKTLVNVFGGNPNVISDTGGAPAAKVGFSFTGGLGFTGDIAEIIAGAGAISAADQFKLNAYLSNRYGIALP